MAQLQTPADQLVRASSRLDVLLRDVQAGARSHREYERQVGEAEAIAAEIRASFRGQVSPQPQAVPLHISDDGCTVAF